MDEYIKIVIIGDEGAGKTQLANTFLSGIPPTENIPTIFNNFSAEVVKDDIRYHFSLWDLNSGHKYTELRRAAYESADIFFLCYALNNKESFHNLGMWFTEISDFNIPTLLIATKLDLRTDKSVTFDEGLHSSLRFKCVDFIEVSSHLGSNIDLLKSKSIKIKEDNMSLKEKIQFCCCY